MLFASAIGGLFDDILAAMKSIAAVLSLVFSSLWLQPPAQAAEQVVALVEAEFWSVPRHAEQLLAQAPLKAAVQQLWLEPDAALVLHYPEGESGELWGLELQAWLVALGVVSDRVVLRPGYGGGDGVAVILVTADVAGSVVEEQSIQENSSVDAAPVVAPAPVQDEVESQ